MEKVSDYLDLGNLQLRKWQTIETIGDSLLDVFTWESPPVRCRLRNPLRTGKSYIIIYRAENSYSMKGLET